MILTPKRLAVLAAIADCSLGPTVGQLATMMRLPIQTVQNRLWHLREMGLIEGTQTNNRKSCLILKAAIYWRLTPAGQRVINDILAEAA